MFKKLLVGVLLGSMIMSGAVFANENTSDVNSATELGESISFKDDLEHLESLNIKLSDDQKTQLESKYNLAVKKDNEEAWDAYYEFLFTLMGKVVPNDEEQLDLDDIFRMFDDLKITITNEQRVELEQLFKKAEKSKSESDWEAVDTFLNGFEKFADLDFEDEDNDVKMTLKDDLALFKSENITLNETQMAELKSKFEKAVLKNNDEAWSEYDKLFLALYNQADSCEGGACSSDITPTYDELVNRLTKDGVTLTKDQNDQLKSLYEKAKKSDLDSDWQAFEEYLSTVGETVFDMMDMDSLSFEDDFKWLEENNDKPLTDEQKEKLKKLFDTAKSSKDDKEWEEYFLFFDDLLDLDEEDN